VKTEKRKTFFNMKEHRIAAIGPKTVFAYQHRPLASLAMTDIVEIHTIRNQQSAVLCALVFSRPLPESVTQSTINIQQ